MPNGPTAQPIKGSLRIALSRILLHSTSPNQSAINPIRPSKFVIWICRYPDRLPVIPFSLCDCEAFRTPNSLVYIIPNFHPATRIFVTFSKNSYPLGREVVEVGKRG